MISIRVLRICDTNFVWLGKFLSTTAQRLMTCLIHAWWPSPPAHWSFEWLLATFPAEFFESPWVNWSLELQLSVDYPHTPFPSSNSQKIVCRRRIKLECASGDGQLAARGVDKTCQPLLSCSAQKFTKSNKIGIIYCLYLNQYHTWKWDKNLY